MRGWVLCALAVAAASSGCARRHPRTVDVAASGKSLEETLADADALYAKRPDIEAVRASIGVYQSASALDPTRVEGVVGVIRSAAWAVEHGGKQERKALAAEALAAGETCQQRQPDTPLCNYWQAVARGVDGREHPTTGILDVKRIITLLKRADEQAPQLDDAGPARVIALAFLRAPGWPVGPGSPDEGLEWAQKAIERAPAQPLNQLVYAEALAATGEREEARAAYEKVAALAAAWGGPDGEDWAAQAVKALAKLKP